MCRNNEQALINMCNGGLKVRDLPKRPHYDHGSDFCSQVHGQGEFSGHRADDHRNKAPALSRQRVGGTRETCAPARLVGDRRKCGDKEMPVWGICLCSLARTGRVASFASRAQGVMSSVTSGAQGSAQKVGPLTAPLLRALASLRCG